MKSKLIDQNIFEELGLNNLPDKEKEDLLENFSTTVMQAVMLRVAVDLPKDKREELEKLIEGENEEAIGKFLQENVENLDNLIDEESLKFKQALINRSQNMDQKFTNASVNI